MNSRTDQQLLRDYDQRRSEAAFAELVGRHVDFVYSAALRMVRDAHLAEDVTQGVFVALAQNARQLAERPVLSGWLHRTAQNLAANAVRTDVRRRAREQEAAAMNELLSAETDASWDQIAPHLDAALGELSDADRDALMLRYFERKSAHEMAQTLGVSDEAAQKRVSRAVERLREFFAERGVTIGASGLVVIISTNAVQAAPVGLAVSLAIASIKGSATATAKLTAIKSAVKLVIWTKGKTAIAVGVGILIIVGTTILVTSLATNVPQPLAQTTLSMLAIEATNLGSFEVSGRFDTTHSYVDGKDAGTNSRTFFFATDGQTLFIHCSAGTQDQGMEYSEFGTDGNDAFYFTKYFSATDSTSPRRAANDSTMSIHPSPLPPRGSIMIQPQWLVYGAGGELKEHEEPFLPPLGSISLREIPFDSELMSKLYDNLLLRADWSLDDQPPHLLSRFVDYRDGKWASRRYSASLIPDEFMSGKTNSRLDVLSWTNLSGLHIPVVAQLTTYLANTNRTGGPLQEHLVHRLIATNVVVGAARHSFIPKLATATRVVDYRFATRPDQLAVYIATNGVILNTADDVWAEVQRQRDAATREREERNRKR